VSIASPADGSTVFPAVGTTDNAHNSNSISAVGFSSLGLYSQLGAAAPSFQFYMAYHRCLGWISHHRATRPKQPITLGDPRLFC
jgi:hypothetical protein